MSKQPEKHTAKTIYSVLKERILNWDYIPGQRFTEKTLCDEFAVSRIPVREALSMLIDNGLVLKERNVGCSVRKLSVENIDHIYEMRTALELYAVEEFAFTPASSIKISDLKLEWEQHAKFPPDGAIDPIFWGDADERFHEGLVDLLENPVFSKAMHDANSQLRFLRVKNINTFDRLKTTCDEHLLILALIEQGRRSEARDRLRENILLGRNNVQASFKEALMKAFL
ncbi:GntR family transcriptional regulator [Pontiella agarivorans]|uniref:GntR family transcriptional regulator n=1 Tax=Pontiella agarivorans TaxID=3038953 RepID=A0ABU5MX64_9BACT|nr:GntR family transcriptional regulator [Pontiella agarivorans]MDZ8118556.1 GntR family transcriptional regulator [Pontiella agarivorans]